jgi:hypothetical protein
VFEETGKNIVGVNSVCLFWRFSRTVCVERAFGKRKSFEMNNPLEQKLNHIISRMQADTAIDAPGDVLNYAKNLFRTRAVEPKMSIVQRVLAVMKMDLAPNRAAFGERSAAGAKARQMLFDSGDNAIDLRVTEVENGFEIRGQVLGGDFEAGTVTLSSGDFASIAVVDAAGGFRFENIASGEFSLVIASSTHEITIEQIVIN